MNSRARGTQFEAQRARGRAEAVQPPAVAEFAALARALEADLDAHYEATVARLGERLPPWMADGVSEAEVSDLVRGSLAAELGSFRRGALPGRIPDPDARGVKAAARLGGLRLLLDFYRVGQIVLWQAWFDRVEDTPLEVDASNELLRYGCEFLIRYGDGLRDRATDLYHREVAQMARSGEQRRFQAIATLLDGGPLLDSQLDLDLDQHHLGVIAWGDAGEEAARALAAALDRRLLLIGPVAHCWWGWLSGTKPLGRRQERALSAFEPPGDGHLAVGLEGWGEEGFRASHRQALRARRVAPDPPPPVTRYADVAVEAMAMDNPLDARAFVAHELRGIDDDSTASEKIRETILAYFAAGHNAASAAAALGIHQQTVANRLRTAEERLGRPVGARRVELETALRLRRCLPSD